MSNRLYIGGHRPKVFEPQFPKLQTFSELVEPLSRSRDANLTQNEYVYATCSRPEIAGDVIFGENVKTSEGYAVLNCEADSFSSVPENQIQQFA